MQFKWNKLNRRLHSFSVLSVGKYVGEKETGLLGILNETKQEMKEIQDRQNRETARGNTSACDESFSGNAQRYLNITHQRLERLENQSRSLIDEVKHIRKMAENFSDTELKVRLALVIKVIFQTLKGNDLSRYSALGRKAEIRAENNDLMVGLSV